jgi:hypothetical protein
MNTAKSTSSRKYRWIAIFILIMLIGTLAAAIVLTLTIAPDAPAVSGGYPHSSTYEILIPEGQILKAGDLEFIVLKTGEGIALKIGDRREEMILGELRDTKDRTLTIGALGRTILETRYRLRASWDGMRDGNAVFRVTLQSEEQIPDWILRPIIPGIQISPL